MGQVSCVGIFLIFFFFFFSLFFFDNISQGLQNQIYGYPTVINPTIITKSSLAYIDTYAWWSIFTPSSSPSSTYSYFARYQMQLLESKNQHSIESLQKVMKATLLQRLENADNQPSTACQKTLYPTDLRQNILLHNLDLDFHSPAVRASDPVLLLPDALHYANVGPQSFLSLA